MIEQDVSERLHPALIELKREVLDSGHPLRIRLFGMSMFPTIRSGDVAIVRVVAWTALHRGDIILYERDDRLVAHRVMVSALDDDSPVVTKGDTLLPFDPPVTRGQLLGQVVALERGGTSFSLTAGAKGTVQRMWAEVSGPYSRCFWKAAAVRRRTLKWLTRYSIGRRFRRRSRTGVATFRPFHADDLDRLVNCAWDLYPSLTFARMRNWSEARLARCREAGVNVWVAEHERKIIGFALLSEVQPDGTAWLYDSFLHPLARGYGWGRELIQTIIGHAKSTGAARICAVVPNGAGPAASLLRTLGWRPEPSSATSPPGGEFRLQPMDRGTVWTLVLTSDSRRDPIDFSQAAG